MFPLFWTESIGSCWNSADFVVCSFVPQALHRLECLVQRVIKNSQLCKEPGAILKIADRSLEMHGQIAPNALKVRMLHAHVQLSAPKQVCTSSVHIHLCAYWSSGLSIHLHTIHPSIYPSSFLSIVLYHCILLIRLSSYLSMYLSICLSACLSVYLSIYPFVNPSNCSLCMCIYICTVTYTVYLS